MLRTILLIIAFVIVWMIAVKFNATLKKHATKFYIIAIALCIPTTLFMFYYQFNYENFPNGFYNAWFMSPYRMIQGGFIGSSIWTTVMLARHIPNHAIKSKLMAVRSELSIIGFFLTFPQTSVYTVSAYMGITSEPLTLIYPALTSVYFVLLLVLGVSSFPFVRKKMTAIQWKKVQRWAYVFYYMLFIQLILISTMRAIATSSSGDTGEIIAEFVRAGIYIAVFVAWHILRSKSKKNRK